MIEALQKLMPWLPSLPIAAKIPLTVVIFASAAFLIGVMWSPTIPVTAQVSPQKIQDMLYELAKIQANWDARWEEVEPLTERARATIKESFPEQAAEIEKAQKTYARVTDISRTLETQLQLVKDRLDR